MVEDLRHACIAREARASNRRVVEDETRLPLDACATLELDRLQNAVLRREPADRLLVELDPVLLEYLSRLGWECRAVAEHDDVARPDAYDRNEVLDAFTAEDGEPHIAALEAIAERARVDTPAVHVLETGKPERGELVSVTGRQDHARATSGSPSASSIVNPSPLALMPVAFPCR